MKSKSNVQTKKVERFFDFTARAFDSLYEEDIRGRFFNRFFRRGMYDRVVKTVDVLKPLDGMRLLDVGSGSGRNAGLFLISGAAWVTGVDFADEMNEMARLYLRSQGLDKRSEVLRADFMKFSTSQSWDDSVALGVFDYVQDPLSFLKKMKSLTTRRVVASFPEKSLIRAPFRRFRYALKNCPVYFYDRAELDELYRSAGFSRWEILPYASSGLLGVGHI